MDINLLIAPARKSLIFIFGPLAQTPVSTDVYAKN